MLEIWLGNINNNLLKKYDRLTNYRINYFYSNLHKPRFHTSRFRVYKRLETRQQNTVYVFEWFGKVVN